MKNETRVLLSNNGELRIPPALRKAMGISVGDEVVLRIEDNELRISSLAQRLARAQRLVRKYVTPGVSLSDELIAERRAEAPHHNIEEHGNKK
jgi:antitoxin PrlF